MHKVSRRTAQVKLPKIGWVRFRLSRPIDGTVRNATVSRDGSAGTSRSVSTSPSQRRRLSTRARRSVLMWGSRARCSFPTKTGSGSARPPSLQASGSACAVWSSARPGRWRSRRKHNGGKYSTRLRTTIGRIAALKSRQARRRADWNHKLTTDLAKNHGLIAVEDLKVRNMLRSAKGTVDQPGRRVRQKAGLNKSIANQGWFEIRRQLGYKTQRYGGVLVAAPAHGSSQTCSKCHVRDPESREGCGRLFACVACGHTEHADRNASRAILDRAFSTAGRKPTTRWEAGARTSGRVGSQSTRSPHGQGRRTASRLREPSPRSPHHDQEESPAFRRERTSRAWTIPGHDRRVVGVQSDLAPGTRCPGRQGFARDRA